MKVMKFGGAVLKDEAGFNAMFEILKKTADEPLLLVVSALSKVTRQLNEIAMIAKSGNEEDALNRLDHIVECNLDLGTKLLNPENQFMLKNDLLQLSVKLKSILRGIAITKELTLRTLDYVLSFGEYFALKTVFHYLKEKNFDVEIVDATDIIITDNNFGNATPDYRQSLRNCMEFLMPKLIKNRIILTQGFVARTRSGEICTMGLESSNLTATFFASALGIEDILFWTDVEGLRTADPKIAETTKLIPEMNYQDAYKSSLLGLKLLHHNMIEFAEKNNLNLIFRSVFNPEGEYTKIHRTAPSQSLIIYVNNLIQLDYDLVEISKYLTSKTFLEGFDYRFFKHFIFIANYLTAITSNLNIKTGYENEEQLISVQNISLLSILNPKFGQVLEKLSYLSSKIDILNMSYSKSTSVLTISLQEKYLEYAIKYLNKIMII